MCPDASGTPSRPPTAAEQSLLRRLISIDFPGAFELGEQLANTLVAQIDDDGSLQLQPTLGSLARVERRVPVEAAYEDDDGVLVHVLVHVIDGRLSELEIYREDGGRVITPATAEPRLIFGE